MEMNGKKQRTVRRSCELQFNRIAKFEMLSTLCISLMYTMPKHTEQRRTLSTDYAYLWRHLGDQQFEFVRSYLPATQLNVYHLGSGIRLEVLLLHKKIAFAILLYSFFLLTIFED